MCRVIIAISFVLTSFNAYSKPVMDIPAFAIHIESPGTDGLTLNKLGSLTISIKPEDGGEVSDLGFDARMPQHNHGMITTPVVAKKGKNIFEINAVKLHMQGDWIFFIFIKFQGKDFTIQAPYKI